MRIIREKPLLLNGRERAIIHALEDRIARYRGRRTEQDLAEQILDIAKRCGSLPDLDLRGAEEILGYDQDGTAG